MAALFISVSRMPLLAPTLDNVDPLFALVIAPGLYLQHVEVADQDPASGSHRQGYSKFERQGPEWNLQFLDR